MVSQPRERRNGDSRREEILAKALSLIGRQGYHGFTIQALAQSCQLSNAGLLHHFGSKDVLLLGVLEEIGRRQSAIIADMDAEAKDGGRNQLRQVLRTIAEGAAADPEVARFRVQLLAESIAPDHPAHDWFALRQKETREMLVRYTSAWTREPEVIALQLHALLNGILVEWLHADCGFDLPRQFEAAVDVVIAGHAKP